MPLVYPMKCTPSRTHTMEGHIFLEPRPHKLSTQRKLPFKTQSRLLPPTIQAFSHKKTRTMTFKGDEIDLPIDLELSLGRIEDSQEQGEGQEISQAMECESMTRTCEQSPFPEDIGEDQQQCIPYPVDETDDEIRGRISLGVSVGKLLRYQSPSFMSTDTRQVDWVPEDVAYVEGSVHDDFSMSSSSSSQDPSEMEENLDLEGIQDRVSFWDEANVENANPPKLAPNVSFSSRAESWMN